MARPLRALIVEDRLDDRELIVDALSRGGFDADCTFVNSADGFATALRAGRWDVILSDYRVPGFGGLEALELLKSSGFDIPFVVVSVSVGDALATTLMQMGASDCIDMHSLNRLAPAIDRELKEYGKRRTARRDVEAAEATSQDALYQLRLRIERMPMAHIVFDSSFRIVDWNPAAEQMTGFTKAEVIAMAPPYPQLMPPARQTSAADVFRRLSMGDMNAHSINENFTKDGRRILCQWWNTPVTDTQGRFAGVMSIVQDVTARESSEQQLRTLAEQLRALSAKVSSAREKEGLRIARELHDELGSSLTAIKWDLEHLATAIGRDDPPDGESLREKLRHLARDSQAMIVAVQRIATELRPSVLDDLGVLHAIDWQTRDFEQRTGITCDWTCADDDLVFTDDQATALFRIVQEALNNVVRHSRATLVQVAAGIESDAFVLRVTDNGAGITADQQHAATAIGLLGMHERAALIGAVVTITGQAGLGTEVMVHLPLPIAAARQ